MQETKTAIAYLRHSGGGKQFDGATLEMQLDSISNFCNHKGVVILKTFSDMKSGRDFNRAGYKQALIYAKKNKPTYLLVWRLDRLGRDEIGLFTAVNDFAKHGTEVNAVTEWQDKNTVEGRFMFGLSTVLAARESALNAQRVKATMATWREKGYVMGKASIGYVRSKELDGNNKRILIPDKFAPIVRRMFELFVIKKIPQADILRIIKEEYPDNYKSVAYRSMISKILRRSIYAGLIDVDGKYFNAVHKAIIPQEWFFEAKKMLDVETITGERKVFLNGLFPAKKHIVCPTCNNPLRAYIANGRKNKIGFYDCREGGHYSISAKKVDAAILKALNDLQIDSAVFSRNEKKVKAKITALSVELKKKQRQTKKLIQECKENIEKADDLILNGLPVSAYNRIIKKHKDRQLQLSSELEQTEQQIQVQGSLSFDVLEMLKDLPLLYDNVEVIGKSTILKTIFPYGFHVDLKSNKCRTPHINMVVTAMTSTPNDYENIIIDGIEEITKVSKGTGTDTNVEPFALNPQRDIRLFRLAVTILKTG